MGQLCLDALAMDDFMCGGGVSLWIDSAPSPIETVNVTKPQNSRAKHNTIQCIAKGPHGSLWGTADLWKGSYRTVWVRETLAGFSQMTFTYAWFGVDSRLSGISPKLALISNQLNATWYAVNIENKHDSHGKVSPQACAPFSVWHQVFLHRHFLLCINLHIHWYSKINYKTILSNMWAHQPCHRCIRLFPVPEHAEISASTQNSGGK